MGDLFNLVIKSAFMDNMVFAYFLGMCSFLAVSKKVSNANGLGLAVIFVLTFTVPLNWWILENILKEGALSWIGDRFTFVSLTFLQLLMFIAVIASFVQLVEMIIEKFSPALYGSLGIFLPLIAVNCSILGGSIFMVQRDFTLSEASAFGLVVDLGFIWQLLLLLRLEKN